eukprot:jgi/Chrzof1/7754/Cz02g35160.t1
MPLAAEASDGNLSKWQENDYFLNEASREQSKQRRTRTWLLALTIATGILAVIAMTAVALAASTQRLQDQLLKQQQLVGGILAGGTQTNQGWQGIKKIAFGSCTAYDLRPQPIWTQGVIPAQPDAWVWLGDFAYMDDPLMDCHIVPDFPECTCNATFMRHPPSQCFAGDPVHARVRVNHQLSIPQYLAFLDYMCPNHQSKGAFPPIGSDPGFCPRPIFGVYDDHDSGWNNGDGRNPAKHEIKNLYLDAIGEPPFSSRRSHTDGLQTSYSLNAVVAQHAEGGGNHMSGGGDGGAAHQIELIMLDERYFRETLPCSAREDWCRSQVLTRPPNPYDGDLAWCQDFLTSGGPGGMGSCCRKDDDWMTWCQLPSSAGHALWATLCDPTSDLFGTQLLVLDTDNTTVLPNTNMLWDKAALNWNRLLQGSTSPMCEMLGLRQRLWLRNRLAASKAPLKIIASGSVLAGSVGYADVSSSAVCSGDDWMCWLSAQQNFLHTLANATTGCVVVIVGDYHYSDIKIIMPGPDTEYATALNTAKLKKPIAQVMSSGLTESTAKHGNTPCQGSYLEDLVGLRPLGRCSYVPQPAFGMIEVDWAGNKVHLQIRNGSSGAVAYGIDGRRQEVVLSLDTCAPVA